MFKIPVGLRPTARPLLITVACLLALMLMFMAACGDEASTSEPAATPTAPVAATIQPTAPPQLTPRATPAPQPTAAATNTPVPVATAIPEPTATATVAPTPVATATPDATAMATAIPEPAAVAINNCGAETVYESVPQRVVATDTSALEVLVALGLQDHVIGYFGGTPDRLQPQHQARAALVERLRRQLPLPLTGGGPRSRARSGV